jgi:hypothetical protein
LFFSQLVCERSISNLPVLLDFCIFFSFEILANGRFHLHNAVEILANGRIHCSCVLDLYYFLG